MNLHQTVHHMRIISKNWSLLFIITILLLSHISGNVIIFFPSLKIIYIYIYISLLLNFSSPYSPKKLFFFLLVHNYCLLPLTFPLCLCLFISPLLFTLSLLILCHFLFLIFWLFFFPILLCITIWYNFLNSISIFFAHKNSLSLSLSLSLKK